MEPKFIIALNIICYALFYYAGYVKGKKCYKYDYIEGYNDGYYDGSRSAYHNVIKE